MYRTMIRTTTLAAAAALVLTLPGSALADSERMQLTCDDIDLVVERTNGSAWWDVDEGTTYTSSYIRVVEDATGEIVHEQSTGQRPSEATRCVADHFGYVWTVDLHPSGR